MALDRRTREIMRTLCGEIHEDDGIDPRTFFRKEENRHKQNRKAHQLCRQVAETLTHVLAGEIGEDLLRELQIVAVAPAPDSSRLLVMLQTAAGRSAADIEATSRRLADRSGRLRCEVAAAITRRKTPVLIFQLIASESDGRNDDE